MDLDERAAIGKSTGMTIGLAIIVIGAAVSAAWWFGHWTGADSAWKEGTAAQLSGIENRLQSIEQGALHDRWTATDMKRWAKRLREDNEDVDVPEPLTH